MTWLARWRYKGRHRGVYTPPVLEPRVRLWDKDMMYLGDVMWEPKIYGLVTDSETPGMMQATFEMAPQSEVCSLDSIFEGHMEDVAFAQQKFLDDNVIAHIPLPDLPFTWTPHYTITKGSLTVTVVPDDPDAGNYSYQENFFDETP